MASVLYARAFALGPADPKTATQLLQQRFRDASSLADELAEYFAQRTRLDREHAAALAELAEQPILSDRKAAPPAFRPVLDALAAEMVTLARVYSDRADASQKADQIVRDTPNQGAWAQLAPCEDRLHDTARDLNLLEASIARESRNLDAPSAQVQHLAAQRVASLQHDHDKAVAHWRQDADPVFQLAQRADAERLAALKDSVIQFHSGAGALARQLVQAAEMGLQGAQAFDIDSELARFAQTPAQPAHQPRSPPPAPAPVSSSSPAPTTPRRARHTSMWPVQASQPGAPLPPSEALAAAHQRSLYAMPPAPKTPSTTVPLLPTHTPERLPGPEHTGSAVSGQPLPPSEAFASLRGPIRARAISEVGPVHRSGSGDTSSKGGMKNAFGRLRKQGSDRAEDPEDAAGDKDKLLAPSKRRTRTKSLLGKRSTKLFAPSFFRSPSPALSTDEMVPGLPALDSVAMSEARSLSPQPLLNSPGPKRPNAEGLAPPLASGEPRPTYRPVNLPGASASAVSIQSILHKNATPSPAPSGPSERRRPETAQAVLPPASGTGEDAYDGMNATAGIGALALAFGSESEGDEDDQPSAQLRGSPAPVPARLDRHTSPQDDAALHSLRGTLAPPPERVNRRRASSASVRSTGGTSVRSTTSPPPLPHLSPSLRGRELEDPFASAPAPTSPANPLEGLTTSIKETVNVYFSGGKVSRHLVVGEVNVHLDPAVNIERKNVLLRLSQLEKVERAAPNPAFLQLMGKEYSLDVVALQGQGGKATVLKYQVLVPPQEQGEYVPLSLQVDWREEEGYLSLDVHCGTSGKLASTLGMITVQAQVAGTGVEASPPGEWDAKGHLTWTVPCATERLRARWSGASSPVPLKVTWLAPTTLTDIGLAAIAGNMELPLPAQRSTQAGTYIAVQ